MSIIGEHEKQPGETLDYDVSYARFFAKRTDDIASVTSTSDPGIVSGVNLVIGKVYKVFISGGTDGQTYKVTVVMISTTGVIKEDEFFITVKEI